MRPSEPIATTTIPVAPVSASQPLVVDVEAPRTAMPMNEDPARLDMLVEEAPSVRVGDRLPTAGALEDEFGVTMPGTGGSTTDTRGFDLGGLGLTGHAGTLDADAAHLGVDRGHGIDPGYDLDALDGQSGLDGRIGSGTGGLDGLGSSDASGPADGSRYVSDGGYPMMEAIRTFDKAAAVAGVPLLAANPLYGAALTGWSAGRVIGEALPSSYTNPDDAGAFGPPETAPASGSTADQSYTPDESSSLLDDTYHGPSASALAKEQLVQRTAGDGQTIGVVGVKPSTEDQEEGTIAPREGGLGAQPTVGIVQSLQQGLGGQRGGDVDPYDDPTGGATGGELPFDPQDTVVDPGPDGMLSLPHVDRSALPDAADLAAPYFDETSD
jgi:hypothetical protein